MSDHRCVAAVPIFAKLDAESQDRVGSFARPRVVAKGEPLYRQGESLAQLFVIHEGVAKLTHARADGVERIVRTVAPGHVLGENAFLTGERPDHSAVAVQPVVACAFDHRDLARLTAEHPGIAVEMLRVLSRRLAQAEHRLSLLSGVEVEARVADYLLDLPGEFQGGKVRLTLPMSKREIASYLGTTPESFSRVLARLSGRGLIGVDGARIVIHDLDGLTESAG